MKTCFVIAPIGESASETRKRSDIVLKYIVSPAAEQCGYSTLRADQIAEPGLITSQVIQHVVDDPLVIADLTERNPNVFYELAIRHAIRKPLVQIIKNDEQIPFDVAGTRTIPVDHKDLESVEIAKQEIVRQIEALETRPQEIETPISVAIELQHLRQSDNPEERSLAEIVSSLSEIKTELANVQKYQMSGRERDRMMMMIDEMTHMQYKSQEDFSRRLDDFFDRQRMLFEELEMRVRPNIPIPSSSKEKKT